MRSASRTSTTRLAARREAPKKNLSANNVTGRRRHKTHYRKCRNGLSGARFTNDPKRLSRAKLEAYAIDRLYDTPTGYEVGAKVLNVENYIAYTLI